MKEHVVDHICPWCDRIMDRVFFGSDASPVAGDITLCFYCASPSVFDASLTPRKPGKRQLKLIETSQDVRRVQALIRTLAR